MIGMVIRRGVGLVGLVGLVGMADAAELPIFEEGAARGSVSEASAQSQGLTALDLGDGWAPRVMRPGPDGDGPGYRESFVALANGHLGEGPAAVRPLYDRYLELHGIPPTFTLLRARLTDTPRHTCREGVADAPLRALSGVVRPWEDPGRQRARLAAAKLLGERLERERGRLGLASLTELGADRRYAKLVQQLQADQARFDAVRALQAHLRCEGTLTGPADGIYAGVTQYALGLFQRQHMLPSKGLLDEDTRAALVEDSRELDFRAILRTLRERVADAAGLIEDGSALGGDGVRTVLGRSLDVSRLRPDETRPALPNGAPDLIGEATDAAAQALGWTSPEAAARQLDGLARAGTTRVALRLPPPPPWHRGPMTLRAEIDRGDVYMAWPYRNDGRRLTFPVAHRPVLIVYGRAAAGDGTDAGDGQEKALVRWPTTIGGWQRERRPSGAVVRKYKESPVGKRIWRRLVVAPAWLPPNTTPPQELVREQPDGWVIDSETMGPGYASAYGLVMLVHEQPGGKRKGTPVYLDQGVRVHGSVSYASIGRGESHGCHRLFNHLALRLGGFILAHHEHRRTGTLAVKYGMRFHYRGQLFEHTFSDRGYEILLDPPISIEVLPGKVFRSLPRGAR